MRFPKSHNCYNFAKLGTKKQFYNIETFLVHPNKTALNPPNDQNAQNTENKKGENPQYHIHALYILLLDFSSSWWTCLKTRTQYAIQHTSKIQSDLSIKLLQNSPQNRTRFMTNPPENSHQSCFSLVSLVTTCLTLFPQLFLSLFGNKSFHIVENVEAGSKVSWFFRPHFIFLPDVRKFPYSS